MTLLYVAGLVGGGIFVVLASIGGLDGVDWAGQDWDGPAFFDGDGSAIADADTGDGDIEAQRPPQGRRRRRFPWLPFLRWRFWTFGPCFFGVTGLLLGVLQPSLPPAVALAWSAGTGIAIGTAATWFLAWLQLQESSDSLLKADDWVGATGVVELPFDASSRGKVSLVVKGTPVIIQAVTRESTPLQRGDRILVIALEGKRAWVAAAPSDRED